MTDPWWASGLFTVLGGLISTIATLSLGLLNRRSERRRLSRERKENDYPELISAAHNLGRIAVWSDDPVDPAEKYAELHDLIQRVAFFAPRKVSETLPELLSACRRFADAVSEIRTHSRPTHNNGVDQRYADQLHTARSGLDQAIQSFATAARADLEIRTSYTLVRVDDASQT